MIIFILIIALIGFLFTVSSGGCIYPSEWLCTNCDYSNLVGDDCPLCGKYED